MHLFYKQTCCENLRSSMASCAQTYLAQRENSHLILPAAQGFKTEWLVVQQCMTKVENSHLVGTHLLLKVIKLWPVVQQYTTKEKNSHLVPPAAQSYETVASCAAIHNQREEVSPCSTCCSKLSNCGQLCSNTQPKRRRLTLFHLLLKALKKRGQSCTVIHDKSAAAVVHTTFPFPLWQVQLHLRYQSSYAFYLQGRAHTKQQL